MDEKMIYEKEMVMICAKSESHFSDNKSIKSKPRVIEKAAVAFANADGGEIFVGIEDEKSKPLVEERWQGAKNHEDFNEFIQCLQRLDPNGRE